MLYLYQTYHMLNRSCFLAPCRPFYQLLLPLACFGIPNHSHIVHKIFQHCFHIVLKGHRAKRDRQPQSWILFVLKLENIFLNYSGFNIEQGHHGWQGAQSLGLVWILPLMGPPLWWPCLPKNGRGSPVEAHHGVPYHKGSQNFVIFGYRRNF